MAAFDKVVRFALLALCMGGRLGAAEIPEPIVCEGDWPWHLQGACNDGTNVYWTFTTFLVKTDDRGRVLASVEPKVGHLGDLCYKDGKIYIGVNGGFGSEYGRNDSICVFDAATLKLEARHLTPSTVFCNNGVEWFDGAFWVCSNAPRHSRYNYLFRYDSEFRMTGCVLVDSEWTNLGVQTICRYGNEMLLGCYGANKDAKFPHPNCTVRLSLAELKKGHRNDRSEGPEICPVLDRVPQATGEGMMEFKGRFWSVHSMSIAPTDANGRQHWRARARVCPELEVPPRETTILPQRDISYVKTGDAYRLARCRLDLRLPAEKGFPTVVWFHGGGLTSGSKDFPKIDSKIGIVSVNYRLMSETNSVRGADCIADAAEAVAWTLDNIASYGGDPKRVFVSGMSAGGYLTMMVGMAPKHLARHGHSNLELAGIIPISGQATKHFAVRKFAGDTSPQFAPVIDELAPLYWVSDKLPPILDICGEPPYEWKCRSEENRLLVSSCVALGHKNARFVETDFCDHGRTYSAALPYLEMFVRGALPADLKP